MEWVDEDGEERAYVPVTLHDGIVNFVPKNAKTFRGVVTEPPLNGLVQMGQGDHISRRLAAFGVDLRDQTRNQSLAREGSLTGALATLDQKSASDTEAKELVFDLLPLEWSTYLAQSRTGHVLLDGKRLTLEKFSSMGNGYTFPLESLIFWAITRACCDDSEVVSVYGDDIICPTHRASSVIEALTCAGFIVNREKSYTSGPFRESCGHDYYMGINVRPFYQKSWLSARTLFVLHNWYVRRGDPERAKFVRQYIHPSLVIYGPDGFGDGHLLAEGGTYASYSNSVKNAKLWKRGYAGYLFDTFTVKGRRHLAPPLPGDVALPSYSVYKRGDSPVLPKDVQRKLMFFSGTEDIGMMIFKARYMRGHGGLVGSLPLPDFEAGAGVKTKAVSLPGDDGYKRVTIYTLGG
jgi:hypothetical protein